MGDKQLDGIVASYKLRNVMSSKLSIDKNLSKGHWDDKDVTYLFKCMIEEIYKLKDALKSNNLDSTESKIANVGNFLMMIYDNEVLTKRKKINLKREMEVITNE